MKRICFATNNQNKLREIREILGDSIELISLKELGCEDELPENQDTLEGNSLEKAQFVANRYEVCVFSDDTGLEVDALNGAPGVYSARYAGPQCSSEENVKKLLTSLKGITNRKARFRTVITLIDQGEVHQFEGAVEGAIAEAVRGDGGFGYDPIFFPEDAEITFSEMSPDQKNKISHRKRAIEKLVDFLRQ